MGYLIRQCFGVAYAVVATASQRGGSRQLLSLYKDKPAFRLTNVCLSVLGLPGLCRFFPGFEVFDWLLFRTRISRSLARSLR